VDRQSDRYAKCRADYVQFVDDKKRQQLTYNDEQIHKYRKYVVVVVTLIVVVVVAAVVVIVVTLAIQM